MNLFMMGARSLLVRNPRPAIHRFGLRIPLACETSDRSMSVPSTGVASTQRRKSIPMLRSWISTGAGKRPRRYRRARSRHTK